MVALLLRHMNVGILLFAQSEGSLHGARDSLSKQEQFVPDSVKPDGSIVQCKKVLEETTSSELLNISSIFDLKQLFIIFLSMS